MSGAVEGVALQEELMAWEPEDDDRVRPLLLAEAGRRDAAEYSFTDANHVIAFLLHRLDAALTTPPARSYADGVEQCADDPGCGCSACWSKDDRAERDDLIATLSEFADAIDRFGFVNALSGHATTLRAAIRLLSQGGKA